LKAEDLLEIALNRKRLQNKGGGNFEEKFHGILIWTQDGHSRGGLGNEVGTVNKKAKKSGTREHSTREGSIP